MKDNSPQARLEELAQNWINGNREAARAQAKKFQVGPIRNVFIYTHGYSFEAGTRIAEHLKGYGDYQAACDAT